MGYWRYPNLWPINIHNQAQGIITFSKLGKYINKYKKKSRTITNWTLSNLQSSEGFFYYEKHKYFTNKIPYMRWNQAWMLYALATYHEFNRDI